MDVDGFLGDALSRRRFIGMSGLAAGSAVLLAGCTDDTKHPVLNGPDESDEADVELLNGLLDLELMAVAAYKAGAAHLGGDALQRGKVLLEQEQEHADGLTAAIRDAGGTPNRAKSAYEFPRWRSERDVLRFAVDLENTAIAAYIDALPKLTAGDLRSTVASILTVEGEHVAVLLDALGRDPLPTAFVAGRAS